MHKISDLKQRIILWVKSIFEMQMKDGCIAHFNGPKRHPMYVLRRQKIQWLQG
jgi:hypothetical protein